MSPLKKFREQCGITEIWNLNGRTFIASTINEKAKNNKAHETPNRAKIKREQTHNQTKINNFKGR